MNKYMLILLLFISQSIQSAQVPQKVNTNNTIQDKLLFYKSVESDIKELLIGADERQKALRDKSFLDRIIEQGASRIFGSSAQRIPLHTIKRSCTDLVGHFISPECIESGWRDLDDEELKGVSLCADYFIEQADNVIARAELHASMHPLAIYGRWKLSYTKADLENHRVKVTDLCNDIKNEFNEVKKDATETIQKRQ
ncbi:MAG TPA: hypothetical protein VGW78_01220 [Candidatus Babeliales bacterium]|nr:hypothetical protein [Candidatus Babeliales bacterium]